MIQILLTGSWNIWQSERSEKLSLHHRRGVTWSPGNNFWSEKSNWHGVRVKQRMSVYLALLVNNSLTDINWWTGVVWIIVMFLSAVWTLILTAPIHCRGSIGEQVMECYISPFLQLIHILYGLRVSTFSANFQFWVNYSPRKFHLIFSINAQLTSTLRHFSQPIQFLTDI